MQCIHSQEAYFHFNEKSGLLEGRPVLQVPQFKTTQDKKDFQQYYNKKLKIGCGRCLSCLLNKKADNSLRLKAELSTTTTKSSFITLTYNDSFLPSNANLNYFDLYKFLDSIRHHLKRNYNQKFSWVYSGELGLKTKRPHYHIILFGVNVLDFIQFTNETSKINNKYFSSGFISHFWPFGFNCVGVAEPAACQYVCGYTVKKLVSDTQAFQEELQIRDYARKERMRNYIEQHNIKKPFGKTLSEVLEPYKKDSYTISYYKDAYNRTQQRKIINVNYPLTTCYKDQLGYHPVEKVRNSKLIGLDYFKQSNNFLQLGYINDPYNIKRKYKIPVSFMNWLKKTDEPAYNQIRREKLLNLDSLQENTENNLKKLECIKSGLNYFLRPLDLEEYPNTSFNDFDNI